MAYATKQDVREIARRLASLGKRFSTVEHGIFKFAHKLTVKRHRSERSGLEIGPDGPGLFLPSTDDTGVFDTDLMLVKHSSHVPSQPATTQAKQMFFVNTPGGSTTSTSYATLGRCAVLGQTKLGFKPASGIMLIMISSIGASTWDLRCYDNTAGAALCEITGVTTADGQEEDMTGEELNAWPTGNTQDVRFQAKRTAGSGTLTVSFFSITVFGP